jgi:hypothetical protein
VQAKDEQGRYTLLLPQVAKLRTMEGMTRSGKLAASFGQRVACKDQGRNTKWEEVRPDLLQQGKFKDPSKMAYLQRTCTEILLEDGLIREVEGGYQDSHGQPWWFPTGRCGVDPKSSGTAWCSSPSMYPTYLCMSACMHEALMHGMQPVQCVSHHPEQKNMFSSNRGPTIQCGTTAFEAWPF